MSQKNKPRKKKLCKAGKLKVTRSQRFLHKISNSVLRLDKQSSLYTCEIIHHGLQELTDCRVFKIPQARTE